MQNVTVQFQCANTLTFDFDVRYMKFIFNDECYL